MKKYIVPASIVIVLLAIFPVYYFTTRHFFQSLQDSGQFGDMFGVVNALFSGFAFLGVIYAIILQREELSLQRKELELTREELRRSAEAQEELGQVQSKQAASLKITAKLNGLSAVLQHHNTLIETTNSAKYGLDLTSFNLHKINAERVISEIQDLIRDK